MCEGCVNLMYVNGYTTVRDMMPVGSIELIVKGAEMGRAAGSRETICEFDASTFRFIFVPFC